GGNVPGVHHGSGRWPRPVTTLARRAGVAGPRPSRRAPARVSGNREGAAAFTRETAPRYDEFSRQADGAMT
ncbi:hypothetical protein AB0J52_37425, partial [Spirillospora sp. NPDC049652]